MRTLLDVLTLSTDYLKQRNVEPARRQAEELLCSVLNLKRMDLYLEFDRPLTDQELEQCRSWLKRMAQHEPIQYIRGETTFLDCTLRLTPDVLIPRQETEILADKIVEYLKKVDPSDKVLWDLCTGSGCLAISIKKHIPSLNVSMSDISAPSLEIAKENATKNNVAIEPYLGDLLIPFIGKKAHYIVCNPPYIATHELSALDNSVKNFEPINALISGPSGLEFYEKLATQLPKFLMPKGKVWFEIGTGQGEAVLQLFNDPVWTSKKVEKDWAGHDRFFSLEIE